MVMDELSLGEYIRRLRRDANRSLLALAADTGISYSHLSRIENDSTIPSAHTIATLAEVLDGDLKFMLEKAQALPRSILDRIATREQRRAPTLRRSAGGSQVGATPDPSTQSIVNLARRYGLSEDDAADLAGAVVQLLKLNPPKRSAVTQLIQSLFEEGNEPTG